MPTKTLYPASDISVDTELVGGSGDHFDDLKDANDSTYIKKTSGGGFHFDWFNLDDLLIGVKSISNVRLRARGRIDSLGDLGEIKGHIDIGGSVYNSALLTMTTSYVWYTHDWAVNPDTSNPWLASEIDALKLGVSLRFDSTANDWISNVAELELIITYLPKNRMLQGIIL